MEIAQANVFSRQLGSAAADARSRRDAVKVELDRIQTALAADRPTRDRALERRWLDTLRGDAVRQVRKWSWPTQVGLAGLTAALTLPFSGAHSLAAIGLMAAPALAVCAVVHFAAVRPAVERARAAAVDGYLEASRSGLEERLRREDERCEKISREYTNARMRAMIIAIASTPAPRKEAGPVVVDRGEVRLGGVTIPRRTEAGA
jgi:hypothetical protein